MRFICPALFTIALVLFSFGALHPMAVSWGLITYEQSNIDLSLLCFLPWGICSAVLFQNAIDFKAHPLTQATAVIYLAGTIYFLLGGFLK